MDCGGELPAWGRHTEGGCRLLWAPTLARGAWSCAPQPRGRGAWSRSTGQGRVEQVHVAALGQQGDVAGGSLCFARHLRCSQVSNSSLQQWTVRLLHRYS